MEYRKLIEQNPFSRIQIKFRKPVVLPKTIPLPIIETFLSAIYSQHLHTKTGWQKENTLRDSAVIELLFATGMRISELCSLAVSDVNLLEHTVLIHGKGPKEQRIQMGNEDVIGILKNTMQSETDPKLSALFANQNGSALFDQAVRRMIRKLYFACGN